jgi:putative endonuclease
LAIDKEKQIKKWSRTKKEALINGDFEALVNLAKKKFDK